MIEFHLASMVMVSVVVLPSVSSPWIIMVCFPSSRSIRTVNFPLSCIEPSVMSLSFILTVIDTPGVPHMSMEADAGLFMVLAPEPELPPLRVMKFVEEDQADQSVPSLYLTCQ